MPERQEYIYITLPKEKYERQDLYILALIYGLSLWNDSLYFSFINMVISKNQMDFFIALLSQI